MPATIPSCYGRNPLSAAPLESGTARSDGGRDKPPLLAYRLGEVRSRLSTLQHRGGKVTGSSVDQDVVDLLTTDHQEVMDLLQQIKTTADPEARRDLADTVISELVRHSVAEEMYVYPAMRKYLPDGDEAVEHDTKEHKQLERTMKKLEAADADSAEFTELLAELEDILRDHVSDEEREQFPQLRARVPRTELVGIAHKVEVAKKVAPTRPHPLAPNNQVFHKLVGPGVGLVDRLRDKLTNRSTS
jgi:hemerythrin superfamily protein